MYVSGLGKVDNRICIVLEWTPEEAIAYSRINLLRLLQLLVSFTLLPIAAACSVHYTLHDQSFSLLWHLKIASETPNHQLLGAQGPRDRSHDISVYETCACVIHSNLLSYIIIVISH